MNSLAKTTVVGAVALVAGWCMEVDGTDLPVIPSNYDNAFTGGFETDPTKLGVAREALKGVLSQIQ